MSNSRKSFVLHFDSLEILDQLTDEQCGKLLLAFREFHLGNEIDLDQTLSLVFFPFKKQFERDREKYQNVVNRNRNNGLKGGRPKNPEEPKKPTGISGNPEEPQKADSVNDSDSDSVNGSNNESNSVSKSNSKDLVAKAPVEQNIVKRFTPPTVHDVSQYMAEKGLTATEVFKQANIFVDFYESKGWMVGKNKMKSWQAAVRNWLKNYKPSNQQITASATNTFNNVQNVELM